ncbi:MAG: leucine-rich repeat protein [Clostridia bacterium]|nr:leucine-rich repeat protein [Clostridia bacterium]
MKKLLTLLLLILMAVSCSLALISCNSDKDDDEDDDSSMDVLDFILNDDDASYTVAADLDSKIASRITNLNIPAEYKGKPVTAISFLPLENLTEVTIPESVTTIAPDTFSRCQKLKSVNIPSKVITIPSNAFYGCNSLTSVRIDQQSSLLTIEEYAFAECGSLKEFSVPSGVIDIGAHAFDGCYSLESINLPSSLTGIGSKAFANCYSLKSINLPSGLNTLEDSAFFCCYSLENITVPSGLSKISTRAFYHCYSLTSVTVPSNIKTVEDGAFEGCVSLKSLTLEKGVESLGIRAFGGESALASVVIPSSVISVDSPFLGSSKLKEIYNLSSVDMTDLAPVVHTSLDSPGVITTVKGFQIYNGELFNYIGSETEITLPTFEEAGCKYAIGKNVFFSGNLSLPSFDYINTHSCKIKSITVPEGVKSLPHDMLSGCINLDTVTLPASLETLNQSSFEYCRVKSINVSPLNHTFKSVDGVVYSMHGTVLVVYPSGRTDKEFTVPSDVHTISSSAFEGCDSLTKIHFEDTSTQWKYFEGRYSQDTIKVDVTDPEANAKSLTKENASVWRKIAN